jgi:hypothetical protein
MKPAKHDLNLYRGDSYSWRFQLWADEAHTVPVNLDGATAAAEIRDETAGVKVVDLPCTIVLPNAVEFAMTPAMYETCPARGVWDLQITYSDGWVRTSVAGSVRVTGDVTDSIPIARSRVRA